MPLSRIQTTIISGDTSDSVLRSLLVPAAPTGLTVTAGNAQATLSWTAPTGVISQAPITDYREQFSTDNGVNWTTVSAAASTATTATITGLTNGVSVNFRVAAVNGVGVGAYTAASAAVTPMAFTPSSIGGLQLWLDAADASTLYDATTGGSLVAADGAVARWEDKSGNGRHFTQSSSGSRPLRKASQQNGKDTLLFDGTNDFFEGSDFSDADSGGLTVFVVYKRNATGTTHELLTKANTNGVGWFVRHSPSDKLQLNIDLGGNNNMFRATSAAVSAASYAVVGFVAVSGQFQSSLFYRNGSAVGMAAASVEGSGAQQPPSTTGIVRVGAQEYLGTTYFHANANIAEVIIYNSALSDTDRAAVESYLMTKWGIA